MKKVILILGCAMVVLGMGSEAYAELGDTDADLVYSSVTPCRIIDTREAGGPIAGGYTRNFMVAGTEGFVAQGGHTGGCGIPENATSVMVNFIAIGPTASGHLRAWPYAGSMPAASIINFAPGAIVANGLIQPICDAGMTTCTFDLTIYASTNVHVVADVMGYFRKFPTEQVGSVPIGAVIDWWRPDATFPVPSGFAICDGHTVSDAGSPLNGKTLPNLSSRFIMGVTNVLNIGASGGSNTHDHTVDINHDHGAVNTSAAGSFTGSTGYAGDHQHWWVRMQINPDGKKLWISSTGDGSESIMYIWDNGINNEGEGIYPISTPNYNSVWYTSGSGYHLHQFSIGSHLHSIDLPALGVLNRATTTVSNVPSYYGLLKIMRIK